MKIDNIVWKRTSSGDVKGRPEERDKYFYTIIYKKEGNMSTGIMIIGPSGSGKTTLGKIVAQKLGYPYFDVDDYIWKQNTDSPYTQMYTRDEKISRLSNDIAPYEHFVMAGSMSSFHYAFDDKFEMMVFLYAEPDIRVQRVHNRAIARFGERVLEGGDMHESHMKFLEENRKYENDGSPVFHFSGC